LIDSLGNLLNMLHAIKPAACFKMSSVPLRSFAGLGSALAVSIGYMDPGNWATDLDATRFANTLLWAVLASGFAAALLQILVVRYAASSGYGLMEGIANCLPATGRRLWYVYALAIVATELAEFVGLVVGIQMLFGCSLHISIALGVAVFALMLIAGGATVKRFEIIAAATTAVLGVTYAIELFILHPAMAPIVDGALRPHIATPGALLAVVGIAGATIMPHNLFLHGGLVRDQLRKNAPGRKQSIVKSAVLATIATLSIATLINAAIVVVGASTHAPTIESAFRTLRPLASGAAGMLFGAALIAAALAATASGACAGDIVCAHGAPFALSRLQRRVLALGPAVALLALGLSPTSLLLASQIALGLALPMVIVPLLVLVLRERPMKTRADLALIALSIAILGASCACDGLLVTSHLPHF
jgi:manganese transport protein